MGSCSSKKTVSREPTSAARTFGSTFDFTMNGESEGSDAISQKKYDEIEVQKIKKELLEHPQVFVLNNLLMSVMFFENFDRDRQRFLHSATPSQEKELNSTLLKDETTKCILPDVVFESVNRHVQFKRLHGPNKHKMEPLAPSRFFVVNDNIEVNETSQSPQYSAIDKPNYLVTMDKSANEGFVKLKCAPIQLRDITTGVQNRQRDITEPQAGPSSAPDSDEVYEYTTIAALNTPKPITVSNNQRRDTLPNGCFTVLRVKKFEEIKDDEDDEQEEPDPNEKPPELFDDVTFVNSNGFMNYFESSLFPHSLGKALGFGALDISESKTIPGKIFCNKDAFDPEFSTPCEIIPAVAIPWPSELVIEFGIRNERVTMFDKMKEPYRWPNSKMLQDVQSLTCALIPKGYTPKRDKNPDSELEWEVGFPKAQRYLETRMNHAQIRVFLFLITLYKSFIEPAYMENGRTKYDGLLVDHLRTHVYWECESNPRDWPEHRLGTKMIMVINNLIRKLSLRNLPDFFIKKKNTFSNVPNKHLIHAQKVLHDVLENPAVYFIGALRQLKYTSTVTYPTLDYKKLYLILTSQNAIELFNAGLRILNNPPNLKRQVRGKSDTDTENKREIRWNERNERINRQRVLQKRREQEAKQQENLTTERRESTDSLNYDWQCERSFDASKTLKITKFFITHFIDIAQRSRRIASIRQALFFLKQAEYLCLILQQLRLEYDIRELMSHINKEEEIARKMSISESSELPPSTPKRNSAQFTWDHTKQQQVKGNLVNISNLNKSYNNVGSTPQSFSKVKRSSSNLKRGSFVGDNGATGRKNAVEFADSVEFLT